MKILLRQCITISLLFLVVDSSAQTQEVKFNLVTGTNGVSIGKITGMTRDKYGFMWFSDQPKHCIIRFDGSHMTRYQNDPRNPNSLGGSYPECIFADAAGNIWVGFYGMGLDKFDPVTNKFTHYRHNKNDPESLSNDYVTAILVDHLGNIWIGDYGGLDLLDEKTGKFKHYSNKSGDLSSLSCNKVRAVYEDKEGVIWVGTGFPFDDIKEGGLNRFNRSTGTFTRYMHDPKNPQSLIADKVRAIFEDSYGNFWVGTNGDGLQTMDRKTGLFTRYTYNPAKPDQLSRTPVKDYYDHITFITEDADKKIWIGTLENGLIRYDPLTKKTTHYGSSDDKSGALKDNTSWWANATPDGLIWLSTQTPALYKIDIYNTVFPHFNDGNSHQYYAFNEDPDSVMWYGTENGLLRKDLKTGTTHRFVNEPGNSNSLSNNKVYAILKDKLGDLWIGTRNGLNHFDIKTDKFTRYKLNVADTSALSNRVWSLCEDSASNMWMGTVKGLDMLNPLSGKVINYKFNPADTNSISNDVINAILEDETTGLWIGTNSNGGLNNLNRRTGKFTHFLPGSTINSLYKDASGIIWAGTSDGLFHYDNKRDVFISIAVDNSVENISDIMAITGDKEDNLWISTTFSGIFMLNRKRDQVTHYGNENGFPDGNTPFIVNSSFTAHDGEVNFGYSGGYYSFNPGKLKSHPGNTQLYFTGFWLDNKEVLPGKNGALLQSLYDTKEIRLQHDQDIFSFSATFIDFHNNTDRKIYYELENFDKAWRLSDAEERIQYYKVPPGTYILHIKIHNNSTGEWIEKSISIIISPPWWTTWWAWCLYVIILGAIIWAFVQYRSRKLKRENLILEEKITLRTNQLRKSLDDLKATQSQLIQSEKMASLGELTAGIAHEIQNPLNFVNNFSEVNKELLIEMKDEIKNGNIDEVNAIADDVIENEEKINHHGKRADAIVKGMLQHSRSSTGVKEPTNINALVDEYLRLSYHGLRAKDKEFNAEIKTDFDQTIGNINIIPQDIGRVLLNLYNNAFYAVIEKKKNPQPLKGSQEYEPAVSVSTRSVKSPSGDLGVVLTVSDNGNGIPQKVIDKIFQPFFTTKPTGEGTGLGLSLSYDIVKAHGGEIKANTKEGEGSEFVIHLPIKTIE